MKNTSEVATGSALELRIRLVREVAARMSEVDVFFSQSKDLEAKKIDLKKRKGEFVDAITSELKMLLPLKNTKQISDINDRYVFYMEDYEQKKAILERECVDALEKSRLLRRNANDALSVIVSDVLAGSYGRGELMLTQQGIFRIIGVIEELDESPVSHNVALNIKNAREGFSENEMREVAKMCKNQQRTPPFLSIGVNAMPLTKEEMVDICRCNVDFELLSAHIPSEHIYFGLGSVYCLLKGVTTEIWLVALNEKLGVIVKMEKEVYPNFTLTQLGEIKIYDPILKDKHYWSDLAYNCQKESDKATDQMTEGSMENTSLALSILAKCLSEMHPGIVIKMPQLEKK